VQKACGYFCLGSNKGYNCGVFAINNLAPFGLRAQSGGFNNEVQC